MTIEQEDVEGLFFSSGRGAIRGLARCSCVRSESESPESVVLPKWQLHPPGPRMKTEVSLSPYAARQQLVVTRQKLSPFPATRRVQERRATKRHVARPPSRLRSPRSHRLPL